MKLKKNSLIILGLSTVALGTIGFSSWIITGTTPEPVGSNVDVTIGDVEDHRIFLEKVDLENNALIFDADSTVEGGGVVAASDGSTQDLSCTASFIIGGATEDDFRAAYADKSVAVTFTSTDLASLVSESAIQSPINIESTATKITELNDIAITSAPENSTSTYDKPSGVHKYTISVSKASLTTGTNKDKFGYKVDITFNFAWGSAFEHSNPVNLTSTSFDDEAKSALTALDNYHTTTGSKKTLGIQISLVGRN